jgi:acyl-CoA reductase-like NAD-dependent aldehyde dehydrogenase
VEVAAQYFEFYGGLADKFFGDTMPQGGQALSFTLREPLGVTAHIVPWNYPIQISSRTVAPAMMAGNACVLKPAEEAPLSALALGELAQRAGLPPGVLNIVPGSGEVAGAALAASDAVDHVAFTGGLETGRLVMAAAARNVKPVTMELGGKSPNIVFGDADLDRAVPVIMRAVIQNAGQTCSAGARLIVERRVHDEVIERLLAAFEQVRVGRGLDDPDLGPLISAAQRDRVLGHLRGAVADGATVAAGGSPVDVPGCEGGFFIAPTLVTGVDPSAAIAQQEVFGPVLTVLQVDGEEEAAVVADGTAFGLVAGVWTRDLDRAVRLSRSLRCGQVFVNSYGAGGGVSLPFGGVKKSGFGREKGVEAAFEYTQTKSIVIDVAPVTPHG